MDTLVLVLLSSVLLVCFKTYLDLRAVLKATRYIFSIYTVMMDNSCAVILSNLPGFWSLVSCFSLLGVIFEEPRRGLTGGRLRFWRRKHLDFQEAGMDVISNVSNRFRLPDPYLTGMQIAFIPTVSSHLVLADAVAIKARALLCFLHAQS